MIIEISSKILQPAVRELLSHATSIDKVDSAYREYIQSPTQQLFGLVKEKSIVGCIGIEIVFNNCEIKHIAVSFGERGNGIGTKMIQFLCENFVLTTISAETDNDAVEFYRKLGFKITSLGEKYPGVERFLCEYSSKTT